MDIHEYQAKSLLKRFGVPVPKGAVVFSKNDIDEAVDSLPGPVWVVKAQIHAGGRGKGRFKELKELDDGKKGGIRISVSSDEAKVNAQEMLGNTLVTKQTGPQGKRVNRLYIENGVSIVRELYCSLLVNRKSGKVCFITSSEGGIDIESVSKEKPHQIHTTDISINDGLSDIKVAKLISSFQLSETSKHNGEIFFRMLYEVFMKNDMSLLEINPLVLLKDGSFLVLDSKISFDNNAAFRHPEFEKLRDITEEDPKEIEASKYDLAYISLDGNIGCMVNGAGLAMATMDLIKLYGAEPANFLDVGGGASQEKVAIALKIIMSDLNVKGILVNIFGGIMRCDVIAKGVVTAVKEISLTVPLVVRLEGTNVEKGKAILKTSNLEFLIVADGLDDSAQKIVKAVKG